MVQMYGTVTQLGANGLMRLQWRIYDFAKGGAISSPRKGGYFLKIF